MAGPDGDARLARAAQAGDLRAFSTLYGRHEAEAFNLALRITGSRKAAAEIAREASLDALQALTHLGEDAPAFATCLMIATRNAAHERSAVEGSPAGLKEAPEGDPGDDPAHEALQQEVGQANFALQPDAREALALAEMDGMSYDGIATVMDLDRESVPALVAGARISLHDELFGSDLAAGSQPEDCEQALMLAAMRDDGQVGEPEDFDWLIEHLAHCGDCRLRLDAMGAAAAGYRRWEPVTPPAGLYGETLAAAARLTGAGADEIPPRAQERGRRLVGGAHGATRALATRAHETTRGVGPTVGSAATAAADALHTLRGRASALAAQGRQRRPRRHVMANAGLLVLVIGGLAAMVAGGTLLLRDDDGADAPAPPAAEAVQPSAPAQAPVKQKRKKRRPEARPAAAAAAPVAPPRMVVIRPQVPPQAPQPRLRRRATTPKKKQPPPPRSPRAEITPAPAPTPAPTPAPPAQGAPAPSNPPGVAPPQPAPPQ